MSYTCDNDLLNFLKPQEDNMLTEFIDNNEILIVKYLSPYKICLLVLIGLYLQDLIPQNKKYIIINHIIYHIENDLPDGIESLCAVLENSLDGIEMVIGNDTIASNGKELLFDAFLDVLFSIKSIDELHTLLSRMMVFVIHMDGRHDELDSQTADYAKRYGIRLIRQSSVLGVFLQKCYLEFDCFNFHQMNILWKSLIQFLSPYKDYFYDRQNFLSCNGHLSRMRVFFDKEEIEFEDGGLDFLQSLLPVSKPSLNKCISSESLNGILEAISIQIEKKDENEVQNIYETLCKLSDDGNSLPVVSYYILYMYFLHGHDQEKSVEYLHRYFDYEMVWYGRAQYHHALFALASLHSKFESMDDALEAITEAVAVARENKDISTLTKIHFWLYTFQQSHPELIIPESLRFNDQLLDHLKANSHNSSFSLYSSSLLFEAQNILGNIFKDTYTRETTGIGTNPSKSLTNFFEILFKSSFVSVTCNSKASYCREALLKSISWERLGVTALSLYSSQCAFDFSKEIDDKSIMHQIALRNAYIHQKSGNSIVSKTVLNSLNKATQGSETHYREWYIHYLKLRLDDSLQQERLKEARSFLRSLKSFISIDSKARAYYNLGKISLMIKQKQYSQAKMMIHHCIEEIENINIQKRQNIDMVHQLEFMILKINIIMV